ncbi:MAG: gluconate 2-dehydrogenase subunit 3 family protein [Candidatus Eremiobacteraeota bacterium]|nr:gluconate 2-dehydrogenase subunit 3 family protein [Candidatus Eremiobacteraeota bacterium]MBV9409308.1 gluconate 2-dehydrogenase subunit 3 family protein [Candidatus Eremiobacteraeota bacterium]
MKEESPQRVDRAAFLVLGGVAVAAVAGAAGCGPNGAQSGATASASPSASAASGAPYGFLRFFNSTEANAVVAMAERIFPADASGPGATDLHVVDFLDGQLDGAYGRGAKTYRHGPWPQPQSSGHGWQTPALPRDIYRGALAAVDAHAQKKHGAPFAQTTSDQQDAMLREFEKGGVAAFTEFPADQFFAMFLGDVTRGLFSDPFYGGNRDKGGWKFLGFPGDPMAYGDRYAQLVDQFDTPYTPAPMANGERGAM